MIEARIGETAVPLSAIVTSNGVPQTGETVRAKIADPKVANSWYDFDDDSFKTGPWTDKFIVLVEDASEPGCYKATWDSSIAISTERQLDILYEIASGPNQSSDKEQLFIKKLPAATDEILSDATPFAGADIAAILADTVNLPADPASETNVSAVGTAVLDVPNTVWDELLAGHLGVGSTGEALQDARDGGDPLVIADAVWDEDISTHTAPGSAGEAQNRLDVDVSTRAVPGDAMDLAVATIEAIVNAILDEAIAGHLTAGTVGQAIAGGASGGIADASYDVVASEMTVFLFEAPAIPLAVFLMKDENGNPAQNRPFFEKVRIS